MIFIPFEINVESQALTLIYRKVTQLIKTVSRLSENNVQSPSATAPGAGNHASVSACDAFAWASAFHDNLVSLVHASASPPRQ